MSEKPQRKYIHRTDGEIYELSIGSKLNADNEQEKVYQLKSDQHYFECSEAELQKFFVKV